jgi:glycosyltransferase involved in cell wall biosynthesis
MSTFSIVIASYGNTKRWLTLGNSRALPTAERQGAHEVIRVHLPEGRVATSRNQGGLQATGDYLVFLDADDELSNGYIDAMQAILDKHRPKGDLLLTPAVAYSHGRRFREPMFHPQCDLRVGNWMVIGTAVPRSLFRRVGGFDDKSEYGAFEDWAFWIKCWKAGALIIKVEEAIYRAYVSTRSRHRGADARERLSWHYEVGRDHFPDLYTEDWLRRRGALARQGIA